MIEEKLKRAIRDVANFPKEGILFKDITPIMMNPLLSNEIVQYLRNNYENKGITKIVGIESRGFLFGFPLAMALNIPFVLVRKAGKLPYDKITYSYNLEYGSSEIEMHTDALNKGDKVLIHDDLLATGGSAEAAAKLVKQSEAEVVGFSFLVGLNFLNGESKLKSISENISILANY